MINCPQLVKHAVINISELFLRLTVSNCWSVHDFVFSFSPRIATEQNIILSKQRVLIWSAMNGNRLGELPTVRSRRRGNHLNHTRFLIHPFLASKRHPPTTQQKYKEHSRLSRAIWYLHNVVQKHMCCNVEGIEYPGQCPIASVCFYAGY